jgi:hypothetical protein
MSNGVELAAGLPFSRTVGFFRSACLISQLIENVRVVMRDITDDQARFDDARKHILADIPRFDDLSRRASMNLACTWSKSTLPPAESVLIPKDK